MEKVNLVDKLEQFSEQWSPRIVGELNGQQVRLAKLQGEFVWHHHDDGDELFLVLHGALDRVRTISRGWTDTPALRPIASASIAA